MTSNSSNIYMNLVNLHKNIMDKLSNENNYDIEKLKKLKDVLKLYNNDLHIKQKNEGSVEKNIPYPTKVHILIGAYYKSLYFIIVDLIGTYGIIENNIKNINTILTNISNVSKILYKIDNIISNHIINNNKITLEQIGNVEKDINDIIQFNTNEYDSIINICEKYQPDVSNKKKKYIIEMINKNEKHINMLQDITTKEELYKEFENSDSYEQYHSEMEQKKDKLDYIRSVIYCIKKDKIPFVNHIDIMKNIKDYIILPWFNRFNININELNEYETKDNIFKAWISSPFVDIYIMDYINQIYYGLKEETINSYKDLKWTSLNSKEQLYEWYEIGDKDKDSIYKLYHLDTEEYEEISYNEKMLLWSAINMVLRQHWKLSQFQNGKIWKNNPQCIDTELSDKLLKQTLDYVKNLVNDDDKTKSLLAKIMGFIHNNDSDDEEKKYIKTEYLKSQYDSFLNDINENIYSNENATEDSKFSIYLKLFNNKYENKNDDDNNIKIDKEEEKEILQEIIDEEKEEKEDNNIIEAGIKNNDDEELKDKIKEVGSIMNNKIKNSFNLGGGRRKKKKRRNKKTRRLKIRKKTKRKYKKRKNKQRKTRKKKRTRRKLKIKIKKKKKKSRKKKLKK